jgi:hypothetical protein
MLVITALMGVVLIGAAALAVDLSRQRNSHRYQQNWGDTAALSGVRACASACNAKTEVQDALQVVLQNSPWSGVSTWLTTPDPTSGCSATNCVVTNLPGPAGFANYLFNVSSPPVSPRNASYKTTSYVQVDVNQTLNTNFGNAIGIPITHAISHSIAYSAGPPAPPPYAFYSSTHAGSGNNQESVVGDTFVGNGYQPASSGKAGLCVYELAGPNLDGAPAVDTDSDGGSRDDDVDDQGHVVFGGPGDPKTYPTLTSPAPPQPSYANDMSLCAAGNAAGALLVETVAPNVFTTPATNNCPLGATSLQNYTGTWICFQPPPPAPSVLKPDGSNGTTTPGPALFPLVCSGGTAKIDYSKTPGVYEVPNGCTVTLDFKSGNDINCVSLDLGVGSSVDVKYPTGKPENYMTSYGYRGPTDTLAAKAIASLTGTHSSFRCAGADGNDSNRSAIWADPSSASPMPIALSNNSTGCCTDTLVIGTIYLLGQSVVFNSNQALEDVGSVYVGDWNVQSGAHPNPVVTNDPAAGAVLRTDIRIVE